MNEYNNKCKEQHRKTQKKGKNKMKTMETIRNIIAEMDNFDFDKLNMAEFDAWSLDKAEAKRGRQRRIYWLKKIGLTLDEWYAWCND